MMNVNAHRKFGRRGTQAVLAGLLGALAVTTLAVNVTLASDDNPLVNDPDVQHAVSLSDAFKKIARHVGPSVVHITSVVKAEEPQWQPDQQDRMLPQDDLLRRFFGDRLDEFGLPMIPREMIPNMPRERRGTGSGVIVREGGVILTNNHVINGADEVIVRVADGREYEATVLGTDAESDLAVIKIDADDLPAASFGDSDAVEPGEWVLAIGNPFGLDQTVTSGIISANHRSGLGLATFENFIQTDAAINPGNSGGPLVNLQGQVIGINTAINTRTGGSDGVGFAIPSRTAEHVLDSILETGQVERGWLGVYVQPLDANLAESFGLDAPHGALVTNIVEDGPAASSGLMVGDIITKVNGRHVLTPSDLITVVAEANPGDEATLTVRRDDRTIVIDLTLGERPMPEVSRVAAGLADPGADHATSLGVTVQDITPELADQMQLDDNSGVVVREVRPGSPAASVGLRRGDVIKRLNGTNISNVSDFNEAMEDADLSKGIRMLVTRNGANRFIFIRS